MKHVLFLLSLLVLACSCAPTRETQLQPSPCDDPQFVQLKGRPIDQMTDREFEYFKSKQTACDEYLKTMAQSAEQKKMITETQTSWLKWYVIVGGIAAVAYLVVALSYTP